jgi:hypothetical protein
MAAVYQSPESTLVVPRGSEVEFKTADNTSSFIEASATLSIRADSIKAVWEALVVRITPPSFCVEERAVTFVDCSTTTKGGSNDEGRGKTTYRRV